MITWFSCTAAFGYQTAPEEFCSTDENLSGQFVHTGPFNIFALFKQNWGTRLNFNFCQWFCNLPLHKVLIEQIQNGVSQLSFHVSMHPRLYCTTIFTVMFTLSLPRRPFQGSSYLAPPQKRLLNREQHFPLFYSRGERPINSFKSNIY